MVRQLYAYNTFNLPTYLNRFAVTENTRAWSSIEKGCGGSSHLVFFFRFHLPSPTAFVNSKVLGISTRPR